MKKPTEIIETLIKEDKFDQAAINLRDLFLAEGEKKSVLSSQLDKIFKTKNEGFDSRIKFLQFLLESSPLKNHLDGAIKWLMKKHHELCPTLMILPLETNTCIDALLADPTVCNLLVSTLKEIPSPKQEVTAKQIVERCIQKNYVETLCLFNKAFGAGMDRLDLSTTTRGHVKKLTSLSLAQQKNFQSRISPFVQQFGKITYEDGKLALAEMASRKTYQFTPTLLNDAKNDAQGEFNDYLKAIKAATPPLHERFIIAGTHWLCGEASVDNDGKVSIIFLDSLGTTKLMGRYAANATEVFPDCCIYATNTVRQIAGKGCSMFALDDLMHLHTLSKYLDKQFRDTGLFGYAEKFSRFGKKILTADKIITIKQFPLPLSLLRTSQDRELLSTIIPERLKHEEDHPVNKAKETVITSAKKHWLELKNDKGESKSLNLRLAYKLNKKEQQIRDFLLTQPDEIKAMDSFTLTAFEKRIRSQTVSDKEIITKTTALQSPVKSPLAGSLFKPPASPLSSLTISDECLQTTGYSA